MNSHDQEQARQFERTAHWLLRESEKLARLPVRDRDRRAREIARRCELLLSEVRSWSDEEDP